MTAYIGRFAPSPTGPLHQGSVVAALASYLDARAHHGRWLVRMEDLDPPREMPGATERILLALQALHLRWEGEVLYQSRRAARYEAALERLRTEQRVYPCTCSRKEIADSRLTLGLSPGVVYPGTCRNGVAGTRPAHAWRFRLNRSTVSFEDRWIGRYRQDLENEVGDFILQRADGPYAYQLAVVVDDAEQGITHVVRGEDLLESTPRQIVLQNALDHATPSYMHVPVVRAPDGQKLSKQTGATAIDLTQPLAALKAAWQHLGFGAIETTEIEPFLAEATRRWAQRFRIS